MKPSGVGFFENTRKKIKLKPRPCLPLKVSIVVADIKNIDVERSSLRSLGSGRRMLIMTMKKCVHVHLKGGSRRGWRGSRTPSPLKMTCGFLIQLVFCQKRKIGGLLVLKTRDEVGEFMFHPLKMVVCLNSAVSFDMYFQQFTLLPSQKPAKAFFLLFACKICLRH